MENKTFEKFLPIGSVVLLNGATKKLMITGYCLVTKEDPYKMYDYSGCLYPEGVLTSSQNPLFNHEQIKEVYVMGPQDDETKRYCQSLLDQINKQGN